MQIFTNLTPIFANASLVNDNILILHEVACLGSPPFNNASTPATTTTDYTLLGVDSVSANFLCILNIDSFLLRLCKIFASIVADVKHSKHIFSNLTISLHIGFSLITINSQHLYLFVFWQHALLLPDCFAFAQGEASSRDIPPG